LKSNPRDFSLVYERESEIASHLAGLGFTRVEIDPEGYRTGTSVPGATGLIEPPDAHSDPPIRSLPLPVLTLK
jgi:hypothetical protein